MTAPSAPRLLGVLQRAGLTILFALAIVFGAVVGILLAYEKDLPQISSLEDFEPNIITQVYNADGSLLGDFAIERRVVVGFKDIPPVLRNAVVAVEDAEFWKHLGVNLWRIPSAAWANIRAGRRTQGSSTLTMQLSRVLFLTPEKSYERKIKEAILAFQIEKNFTKEEIFTFYCNQVYFGHGNYGVEATSRFLYGKPSKDLTLSEAALVAGLPQNPSRLSPLEHPERATARRNHVLSRMVEEKYISPEEGDQAKAEPSTCASSATPRRSPRISWKRSASTWSANTGASASTRAASGSTPPSTPPRSAPPTAPCSAGCRPSTGARAATCLPRAPSSRTASGRSASTSRTGSGRWRSGT